MVQGQSSQMSTKAGFSDVQKALEYGRVFLSKTLRNVPAFSRAKEKGGGVIPESGCGVLYFFTRAEWEWAPEVLPRHLDGVCLGTWMWFCPGILIGFCPGILIGFCPGILMGFCPADGVLQSWDCAQ